MNLIGLPGTALSLLLLLCALPVHPEENASVRTLAKGAVSGIREPKEEVIRDEAAWEKLWNVHVSGRQPAPTRPPVDFSKEMVVVVTLGTKRSGGYAVEIRRVEPVDRKLRVSIARSAPRPGAITLQALTAPFHMVAVARSPLPVEFVEDAPTKNKAP